MRLIEIEVRDWRGLTHTIADLSSGLNLILGANESGKSRTFEALHFAMFESFKGAAQHKQKLQSWRSRQTPFVRIKFELDGTNYEITKQFLKGGYASLEGGGNSLRDEDAESRLRQLLKAGAAGSRQAANEDLGFWPLLMVTQGTSCNTPNKSLNGDSKDQLQQRLSAEIGVAAISANDQHLLDLLEQEYARFYTPTGQEAILLRNARGEQNAAQAKLAEVTAAHAEQAQLAAALATVRTEVADLEQRVNGAKSAANEAREKARAAQQASTLAAEERAKLQSARMTVEATQQEINTRVEADEAVDRMAKELAEFDKQRVKLMDQFPVLESEVAAAMEAFNISEREVAEAKIRLEAMRKALRRKELEHTQAETQKKIAALKRIERDATAARAERAALAAIDDAALAKLKILDRAARDARVRLQGAAVSVAVRLRKATTVDGDAYRAGDQVQIDVVDNRDIVIGDVASVEVRPGRGALDRLRESSRHADEALSVRLNQYGVVDIAAAETIFADLNRLNNRIQELATEARATSDKTAAQLSEEHASIGMQLQRYDITSAPEESETQLEETLGQAEDALAASRGCRDAADKVLQDNNTQRLHIKDRRDGVANERNRLVELYAERLTAGTLRKRMGDETRGRAAAQTTFSMAEQAYRDLGGDSAGEDAQRLAQSVDNLSTRMRDKRTELDRLQGELSALTRTGSYELVQQAQARLTQANLDLNRMLRRATAARRLRDLLQSERKRVIERLTAPVTQRIAPYLADLFPGSVLASGDALDFVGLQTGNVLESHDELSGGAQEQLALLTRIGLAEVLAGDGTLPLLLDDALVNTDPNRIKLLYRALYRAAKTLQVILFSCHDVLFDGLGAERTITMPPQRRLERAASSEEIDSAV